MPTAIGTSEVTYEINFGVIHHFGETADNFHALAAHCLYAAPTRPVQYRVKREECGLQEDGGPV
jgi:hypothetical protein